MDRLPVISAPWLARRIDNPLTEGQRHYLGLFFEERLRSETARRNYARELERFIAWLIEQGLTLDQVGPADMQRYRAFLADPPPHWRMSKRVRRQARNGELNPEWRPFLKDGLNESSVRQALSAISSALGYLELAGVLARNPTRLIGRRTPAARNRLAQTKYFDPEQWKFFRSAVDQLPVRTSMQRRHAARSRFLLDLLYWATPRGDEVVRLRWKHVVTQFDCTYLHILGKGEKWRRTVIHPRLRKSIIRYRQALGLSDWPAPEEDSPILTNLRQLNPRPLTRRRLGQLIDEIGTLAAEQAAAIGRPDWAALFRKASPHWLRHTGISHMLACGVDPWVVQAQVGHEKIETTMDVYTHVSIVQQAEGLEQWQ